MVAPKGDALILLWRTPVGRWFAIVTAVLFFSAVGLVAMTAETGAVGIAYCVTAQDSLEEPLHVSLMEQRSSGPARVLTGETRQDGCGEFSTVPRTGPVMIVVWTTDGFRTGSTGWLDPDAVSEPLVISLASQASPLVEMSHGRTAMQ